MYPVLRLIFRPLPIWFSHFRTSEDRRFWVPQLWHQHDPLKKWPQTSDLTSFFDLQFWTFFWHYFFTLIRVPKVYLSGDLFRILFLTSFWTSFLTIFDHFAPFWQICYLIGILFSGPFHYFEVFFRRDGRFLTKFDPISHYFRVPLCIHTFDPLLPPKVYRNNVTFSILNPIKRIYSATIANATRQ